MIVYFADRQLNILGQASTELPQGLRVTDDKKVEEIETGIATFECDAHFNKDTRAKVESYTAVGNYILRNKDGENELYTIIESELDTKKQVVYIYAEDAGLDLINEVVGAYEADKAYAISHYVNKYASNAGFVIGINEAKDLTRKLSWDGESTATERLASIATQFDGCEISYRYEIEGLSVVKRYIDIYKERGADLGVTLFLNKDIDNIITTKSITNLATALICTGGTPEDENLEDDKEPKAITLKGYKYDDGDFYVDGQVLKSRKALKRWSRFLWKTDEAQQEGGHITRPFSYDTLSQSTLCKRAITELKKICDTEINYEIDIKKLPDNVKIGDRVNIVDDAGELYVSTRVLKLVSSVSDQEYTATLGEHLIKTSGIHQKVAELAAQFASTAHSATRALVISNNAKSAAESAQSQASAALESVTNAQNIAAEAKAKADAALQSATEAQTAAGNAQAAVDNVEESVTELETTINNANQAAQSAQQAATTAEEKATEANRYAKSALADAATAKAATEAANDRANLALSKASEATDAATNAKTEAQAAKDTANAAKLDAESAQKDVGALAENLDTVVDTMTAEYTRKTELTETSASLQSQITRNAAEISSTMSKVVKIDETTNDAQKQLLGAKEWARIAQEQADVAQAEALAAQNEAAIAEQAAVNAQSEADNARAAADTAKAVADEAEADLKAAIADLETVSSRVDATEEEIAAAQQAVTTAQATADIARVNAQAAMQQAAEAQRIADTATADAEYALLVANDTASQATLAQKIADEAKGDATAAQQAANEAAETAAEAQRTASEAVENAIAAQTTAIEANSTADDAQRLADDADTKAQQAAADLAAAQQRLNEVTSNLDATEEEIAAAQQAVDDAQTAADIANAEATTAQAAADTARSEANAAKLAADNAKAEADNARAAAIEAQTAADEAQGVVEGLAVRVTKAETEVIRNADLISMGATKEEVLETLGGYYTKTQSDAKLSVAADKVTSNVQKEISGVEDTANNAAARVSVAESTIEQLADSISTLITDSNGASLMKFENGRWTFSTAEIQGTVEQTTQGLSDLLNSVGDIDSAVDILQSAVDDLGIIAEYVKIGTYTYIDDEGAEQTEPSIDLGETDTGFRLKITNTRIAFTDGAETLVYIDSKNKSLNTEKVAVQEVQIGGSWVWKIRANGNLGLMWKGAE